MTDSTNADHGPASTAPIWRRWRTMDDVVAAMANGELDRYEVHALVSKVDACTLHAAGCVWAVLGDGALSLLSEPTVGARVDITA